MTINSSQQENYLKDFLEEVFRVSQTTNKQYSVSSYQIRLAGQYFRLHIPNTLIAEIILPPLEHLRVSEKNVAEVDIFIWDSQSTGIDLPKTPWGLNQTPVSSSQGTLDGQTIFYQDQNIILAFQVSRQNLSIADVSAGQAIFWVPSVNHLYPLDGRPLRNIFQWFLDQSQHQIVHAAGIGFKHGGLIITGKSGAGKSTTTVACLNSPLALAGDENVILSTQGPPTVYSLYNSANLDQKSLSLLPFMTEQNIPIQEHRIDKSLFYLHQSFPDKIISSFPLKAIVVSQINGKGAPHLEPLSAAAALTALAPTSIFQIPGNKQTAFFRMSQIVKNTPCYQLTVGESLNDIPPLLIELINAHPSQGKVQ